ncbi:MAG: protein-tyrosine kinase [Paraglaciecola sp.]|jgi:protein-tyrosine kinase
MNTIERALSKQNASKKDETTDVPASEPVDNMTEASPIEPKKAANSIGQITIDLAMLEAKGLASIGTQRRQINEEYRAIKRKVLNNAFGPLSQSLTNSNIVMITSSRPGEGKTFTAVNLALNIALEQDLTVLLVDADVLRPNVMRTLGLDNQEGLMEYLLGEKTDVSEIICNTNIPNLRIISAGKSHHLSTELLASEKMYEAVQEFANRYTDRIVIVDTPPLLGVNETAILANLAGQAIIVTAQNSTKLSDIQQAVTQLNPEMAIGFVINKAQRTGDEASGYGYYYYGEED